MLFRSEQAIARLVRAISEYFVGGIKTNLELFQRILADSDFHAGRFDTGFLERLPLREEFTAHAREEVAAIAAGMFSLFGASNVEARGAEKRSGSELSRASSTWKNTGRREALQATDR